jgi:hypothetical protein
MGILSRNRDFTPVLREQMTFERPQKKTRVGEITPPGRVTSSTAFAPSERRSGRQHRRMRVHGFRIQLHARSTGTTTRIRTSVQASPERIVNAPTRFHGLATFR